MKSKGRRFPMGLAPPAAPPNPPMAIAIIRPLSPSPSPKRSPPESAIIISESDHLGKVFFKDLYNSLNLNIFEYTFDEHDETVAYSLSIPFVSTFVFAAVMKHQEAPGTTFKKHMAIAKGLLSEDDYLLQEILFNPRTPSQVENIRTELKQLLEIITNKDAEGMKKYLTKIREKIK